MNVDKKQFIFHKRIETYIDPVISGVIYDNTIEGVMSKLSSLRQNQDTQDNTNNRDTFYS